MRIAFLASTLGAQPEIVPSSVAKMKTLALETTPLVTAKSEEELKTIPVGVLGPVPLRGGGIVTTNDCGRPAPS